MYFPFIGRYEEINTISNIIGVSKGTTIIFIGGDGGIGKSRLLRKICKLQESLVEKSQSTKIIDFDDPTFSHLENVFRKISQLVGSEAFTNYFQVEKDFQQIHVSNVSAAALAQFENKVKNTFVECFNAVSTQNRIVLYFDTTDKLLAKHGARDNLLSILPRLKNTVVLLAGRNADDLHSAFQKKIDKGKSLPAESRLLVLAPFSVGESQQYLAEKAAIRQVHIEPLLTEKLIFMAEGTPILLDLAVDWRARGISLKWLTNIDLSALKALDRQQKIVYFSEFRQHLVSHVLDLKAPMDRLVLMLAQIYPLNSKMLSTMVSAEDVKPLFTEAQRYSFIKTLPGDAISLHDVMRDLVDRYVWPHIPAGEKRRKWYSQNALQYYRGQIGYLESTIAELEKNICFPNLTASEEKTLLTATEEIRQQLWVLREQLLKHSLIADPDEGVTVFEKVYQDASKDARITLIPKFIQMVEEKRERLSKEQVARLEYYKADQLFSHKETFDATINITEKLLRKNFLPIDIKIKCTNLKANSLIRLGRINDAIKDFKEAVNLSRTHRQTVLLMVSTNALGWAYRSCYNMENALIHYKEARKIYHQAGREQQDLLQNDYGLLLNNLAVILANDNRTRKAAIDMAGMAVLHWKKIGNQIGLGKGYHAQGICYLQSDLAVSALEAFQKALEIFEPLGLKVWSALILSWRGVVYHNTGRNEEAEKDLARSLDMGPKHIQTMTLNKLGCIHLQREDWDQAEKYFRKSLRLAKAVPDYKYWLDSLARLIHIAAQQAQTDRLEFFKGQLDESLKKIGTPDKHSEGIARLGLAKLAFLHNSPDKVPFINGQLEKGIPLIVVYGAWARTDIITQLGIIEEDFGGIDPAMIRMIGEHMVKFLYQIEAEDFSYSAALEIVHKWARWEGIDSIHTKTKAEDEFIL